MSTTRLIRREQLADYFDSFVKRFLRDGAPEAADIEILDPTLGDQVEAQGIRLIGITYDRHTNAVELAIEGGDHRINNPAEVWVVEEPDGFASAIEVVPHDGPREVIIVKRVGIRPLR